MSSDWPLVRLDKVLEITSSKRIKRAEYVTSGIPFFRSKEVIERSKGNEISTELFISEKQYEEIRKKFGAPESGDILLTSVGTLGVSYQVHESDKFYFKDGNLTWFRKFQDNILSEYVLYWIRSPHAQQKLDEVSIGSTQRALTIAALKSLEIPLPPKIIQAGIVRNIRALEQKIETNRGINQTLEQMAQAIFKSWFVDFEPVKAKIAVLEAGGSENDALLAAMQVISGKDPQQLTQLQTENPEHYTILRATAELFPAAMQESELGGIPEGWTVSAFSKIARLDTSSVNPGQEPEKIWEHYSIPAFDKNGSPAHELGSEIKSGKYKVHPASILSSKLNPHFPRTWIPNVSDQDAAICSTEFMQFVPNKKTHRPFVAGLITSRPFQAGIMMRVTGSTGSRQRAQPREVAVMEIVLPPAELIDVYSTIASPILKNAAKNISQIITLAELRDTLLPKLLSGELSANQDAD